MIPVSSGAATISAAMSRCPSTRPPLGGEITVPTLTGQVALRIPQGTQNGRVFRLAGQGMPRLKRDGRGDLLVAVRLRMPAELGPEHLDLFRRLRDLEAPDA